MGKVIALVNQKGGVAKTTSSLNLGVALARKGKKVLLIDADPQGSLTVSLGWQDTDNIPVTVTTIMNAVVNDEAIIKGYGILHHAEGVDLVPANIDLAEFEPLLFNCINREYVLRTYIDTIREDYDYIIIDAMPSLGMVTINVLAASDSVIIPMNASFLSYKGFEQLVKTIIKVRKKINKSLCIEGVLLTMTDLRTSYEKALSGQLQELAEDMGIPFFSTDIPKTVRFGEASFNGRSIFSAGAKTKRAADAYDNLAAEVIEHGREI